MSDVEYAEFADLQIEEYARQKARAGDWSAEEALDRSAAEHADLKRDRLRTAGHRFFTAVDDSGRRLGWIWEGPPPPSARPGPRRWLYQITVVERLRGRGFGRGMLDALVARLARDGVDRLELHVFKWNEVAIALYRSAGFEVCDEGPTDLNLGRDLRPRSRTPGA